MKKKISKKINLSDLVTQKQLKYEFGKAEKRIVENVGKEMQHNISILNEEFQSRLSESIEVMKGLHEKTEQNFQEIKDMLPYKANRAVTDDHEQRITVIESKIVSH